MFYYLVKISITAVLVVAIAEIAKRSTLLGAFLASVPVVSVLAMVWLYVDTRDSARVAALATSVFWLVLPSLALFVALPVLLRRGVDFSLSLGISLAVTALAYAVMIVVLQRFGVRL